MPTRLIILRHGETQWNIENKLQGQGDSKLTEQGKKQVTKSGMKLVQELIDVIYISSLGRTIQTYELIKPFIKDNPVTHISDCIVERSFGEGEGMTLKEIQQRFPEVMKYRENNPYLWKIPGGESYQDIKTRASQFVDEILQEHKNKTILLVTHGGISKVLLLHYQRIPLDPWPYFTVPNAAINILKFTDNFQVEVENLDILES